MSRQGNDKVTEGLGLDERLENYVATLQRGAYGPR